MIDKNEGHEKARNNPRQSRQERRIRWQHGLDGSRARLIATLCFGGEQ
jgi:hypothetical protein